MIRKFIIAVLTLGALSLIVVSIVTIVTPLFIFHTTYSNIHYDLLPWTVRWDNVFPYPFIDWSQVDHEVLQCNSGLCLCTIVHTVSDAVATTPGRMKFGGFFAGMTYEVRRSPSGPILRYITVSISLLFPVLLASAYPIFVFIRGPYRRWRRRHKGLCVKCGYDLRESPNRCPECGLEIASSTANESSKS